jgi:hypothetical protein
MNLYRIATVKATGKKYVVQQLDFRTNQAHCWGELMSFDTKKNFRTFEGALKFPLDAVTITKDVTLTQALLDELFAQSLEAHKELIENGKMNVRSAKYRK